MAVKLSWILLLIYSTVFFTKLKFNNEVVFSGDAWHYQSMAVNWAKGFGLMRMGQLYGDYHQDYKFAEVIDDKNQPRFNFFVDTGKTGGSYSFYRTPGYILFMGTIYRLFGVNPIIVKQVQLLLIIFIAAFLPYLGWHYWQKTGLLAGFFAGLAYLKEYARNIPRDYAITYPTDIMAEGLIAFGLFILILLIIFWQKRPTKTRAILLGVATAINLLIKGTNIFIPLILIFWLGKRHFLTYLLGLTLIMLPWSIYASQAAGKIVFLSTQSEDVLLDNNNEFAFDGGWHPEGFSYAGNAPVFYRQPEVKDLPLLKKLAAFFLAYPEMVPNIFLAKIKLGFGGFTYFTLSLILIGFKIINQLFRSKITVPGSILTAGFMHFLWQHPALFNISRPPIRIDLLLLSMVSLLAAFKILSKRSFNLNLPAPFIIAFINYLLLALIVCGWPRINQVLDFIFMLVFFKYFIDFIVQFLRESVKIIIHAH